MSLPAALPATAAAALAAGSAVAAPAGTAGADDDAFDVGAPLERLALLHALRDGRVAVTLTAPGLPPLPVRLRAVEAARNGVDGRLALVADAPSPGMSLLLQRGRALAQARLDGVPLTFELAPLVRVHSDGEEAELQAPLPLRLQRWQRRDSFRVRAPAPAVASRPPPQEAPRVQLRHPAWPDMALALRLLDISAGGCSLWLPAGVPPLEPGSRLAVVEVLLEPALRFAASLTVLHLSAFGAADDAAAAHDAAPVDGAPAGLRLGCAWEPAGPAAGRALQRWIDQLQRRRPALPR